MDLRNKVTNILIEAKANIIAAMTEEVKNNGGYIDLEDTFSYEDDEGRNITPREICLGTNNILQIKYECYLFDYNDAANVFSIEELDTICDILLMNINK